MKEVEFADVCIPLALASYCAPPSSVGSILHPTQDMDNEVSEAMAKADASPPPYKPYVAPDYSPRPGLAAWLAILTLWEIGKHASRERMATGAFVPNVASSPRAICFRVGPMSRVGSY